MSANFYRLKTCLKTCLPFLTSHPPLRRPAAMASMSVGRPKARSAPGGGTEEHHPPPSVEDLSIPMTALVGATAVKLIHFVSSAQVCAMRMPPGHRPAARTCVSSRENAHAMAVGQGLAAGDSRAPMGGPPFATPPFARRRRGWR